jgi:RNA polymerase sigma-70 factor, ECF subfamily
MSALASPPSSPEQQAVDHELGAALEAAIDALPPRFREVFMLREVEGLSTAEIAECLEIGEQTAKSRLHRARTLLRDRLRIGAGQVVADAFPFGGARCDRVVTGVLRRFVER